MLNVDDNYHSNIIFVFDYNDDDDAYDGMRAGGHQPPTRGGHILLAG